jgi:multidrug efflux pump subunit AcrA (membrane-fusion protein)
MSDKKKSLTVFKTDRHEDVAAIIASALIVVVVLCYMAFVVPSVSIKPQQDGKLVEIFVKEGAEIKAGDKIFSLEVVKKKWVNNVMEEKTVTQDFTSKAGGKVLKIAGKPGDKVKKDKGAIVILEHVKGTLP